MKKLSFKRSCVSLVTLAALMGTSQVVLGMNTPPESPEPERKTSPNLRNSRELQTEPPSENSVSSNNATSIVTVSNRTPESLEILGSDLIWGQVGRRLETLSAARFSQTSCRINTAMNRDPLWQEVKTGKLLHVDGILYPDLQNYHLFVEQNRSIIDQLDEETKQAIVTDVFNITKQLLLEEPFVPDEGNPTLNNALLKLREGGPARSILSKFVDNGKFNLTVLSAARKLITKNMAWYEFVHVLDKVAGIVKDSEAICTSVQELTTGRTTHRSDVVHLLDDVEELGGYFETTRLAVSEFITKDMTSSDISRIYGAVNCLGEEAGESLETLRLLKTCGLIPGECKTADQIDSFLRKMRRLRWNNNEPERSQLDFQNICFASKGLITKDMTCDQVVSVLSTVKANNADPERIDWAANAAKELMAEHRGFFNLFSITGSVVAGFHEAVQREKERGLGRIPEGLQGLCSTYHASIRYAKQSGLIADEMDSGQVSSIIDAFKALDYKISHIETAAKIAKELTTENRDFYELIGAVARMYISVESAEEFEANCIAAKILMTQDMSVSHIWKIMDCLRNFRNPIQQTCPAVKSLLKDDNSADDIVNILETAIQFNPYSLETCIAAKDLITVDMSVSDIISLLEELKEKKLREHK